MVMTYCGLTSLASKTVATGDAISPIRTGVTVCLYVLLHGKGMGHLELTNIPDPASRSQITGVQIVLVNNCCLTNIYFLDPNSLFCISTSNCALSDRNEQETVS